MAENVGHPRTSRNYLQVRPSLRVAPPNDPRMAKAQRWTVWTIRPPAAEGKKPSKVPVANPTDPSTWSYFPSARSCLEEEKIAGLGFEMHGRPEIIGIDIDNCLDEVGTRSPVASQLLSILAAARTKCHVEISPSGKGLRIFAGETPTPFHDFTNKETGVEVYTGESGRFLAFTGHLLPDFMTEGPFDPLPPEAIEWLGKHASKWRDQNDDHPADAGRPVDPLPDLSRREDWRDLYPKTLKRLSKEHREFLESGAIGGKYGSASEHLFAVEQRLLALGLKLPQAFQVLLSAEGTYGVALEHREGSHTKAKEFIWEDLQRAAKSKEQHEKDKAAQDAGWKDCDIIVEITEEGAQAKALQLNMIRAFEKHPEWILRLGFDEFNGVITIDKKEITTREVAEASAWVVDFLKWGWEPKRQDFLEALEVAARTRTWNPVRDMLEALVWDARPRIKKLTEAVVKDPEPLDYELMRRWLVGFIARGMDPGCQMDTVLCLRGEEGSFKTSFCRTMAERIEWFGSAPKLGLDQESSILRVGKRILEVGEGVAANRAGRHELKDDVTRLFEDYRPKYGRTAVRVMRSFVYVLTANPVAFLRSDQDGLRRFWPVDVRDVINIEWVRENRDQLLAEAVKLYKGGKRWWFDKHRPEDAEWNRALKLRVATAVCEDPLDAAVESVIADPDNKKRGYTTLNEIKRQVEGIAGLTLQQGQVQHLVDICIKNGLKTSPRFRIGGKVMRTWRHDSWAPVEGGKVFELRGEVGDGAVAEEA